MAFLNPLRFNQGETKTPAGVQPGQNWDFTDPCAPPISAVSRGFITWLPPTSYWPIATDFMRAPSLAVELLFAASSSTNHIIGLQHYSMCQGSMTWSLSLSLSCCCLPALVCYMVVLLSSEWFLPVILLNIEISIESSLCVSFSVCACAHPLPPSFALWSSLPPPSPFSFLPLCLFRFSSWAVLRHYRYCLFTMSTGGGISPFDLVSLDAQTPAGLYRSLEGLETWWRAVKKQFCECVWLLENVISS